MSPFLVPVRRGLFKVNMEWGAVMSPMGALSQKAAPLPVTGTLTGRTVEADRFNPCAGQDEAPYLANTVRPRVRS